MDIKINLNLCPMRLFLKPFGNRSSLNSGDAGAASDCLAHVLPMHHGEKVDIKRKMMRFHIELILINTKGYGSVIVYSRCGVHLHLNQ